MTPTRKYISVLLSERAKYAAKFGLKESRTVYNCLIKYHIRAIKYGFSTLVPNEDFITEGLAVWTP